MKLRILAFASAADALGTDSLSLELPAGSSVGDLQALLEARHPALAALWGRIAVAVDGEVVERGEVLTDGAEVALLPPVSGGATSESGAAATAELAAASPAAPAGRVALVEAPIDAAAVLATVSGPERGAVVLFLGTVRGSTRGRAVTGLTYSAYRSMAAARLAAIVADLEREHPGLEAAITHRLGDLVPGEASVAIAVAAPHRAAAYEASRTALERLKAEVPIWKREHYADGGVAWREEESLAGRTS